MNFSVIIFSSILSTIFGYLRQKFTYWDFQDVKQLKTHFLVGNFFKLKTVHHSALLQEVYDGFKGKVRVAGTYIFTKPVAVVLDLQLVKNVLITQSEKFVKRPEEVCHGTMPSDQWLRKRSKLDELLTADKMEHVLPTIQKVCQQLEEEFSKELSKHDGEVEMQNIAERFISDLFGSTVFGIECSALQNPEDAFYTRSKALFRQRFGVRNFLLLDTYPILRRILGIKRDTDFLESYLKPVMEQSLQLCENSRNDYIANILKNSNDFTSKELAELLYSCYIEFYESSVSLLSQALYELAKNSKVQNKLRTEILKKLESDDLTYDNVMSMSYLQQVVTETLRLHSSVATISRLTNVEYEIPDTKITLEKGTHIMIPVKAIHSDPAIYDKPQEFRPERFANSETDKRHAQAFLGWGTAGSMRYARLQISAALVTLLKRHQFTLSGRSPKEIQPKDEYVTLVPKTRMWLQAATS